MKFNEGLTVGIDLGTTFSTLAILDDRGEPVAVANEEDELETPSMILLAESGHVIVGPNRARAAMEDPSNVVERIKRHMGQQDFKRTFDGREITPEFLSALILKKLKQDAEKKLGKIGNAVITVPYYFNDQRRKATQDAGKIAGLNVVDIINEPTAATLTYAWHQGELGVEEKKGAKPKKALVYDLGGGTFDVTVVQYTPTHFQVLATDGDVQLGGIDWNDRILDFVAEEFKSKHGIDPRQSPQAVHTLRNDCDLAKLALSESDKTVITLRHLGKAVSVPLTRAQFEEITADLLQRTIDTTELVLEQAKLTFADLDAVVPVGGATLTPMVQRALSQISGRPLYTNISPFTSVAQGAALHAAIIEAKHRKDSKQAEQLRKRLSGIQQDNVNSHGLGIIAIHPQKNKKVNQLMIRRNTRLPVEAKQVFKTAYDSQDRINVKVTEGDAPSPEAVSLIGNCHIHGLPKGTPKGAPVEVTYSFDASGRVSVSAKDVSSGKQAAIQIDRRGGLTESQVDIYSRLASDYHVE